MARLGDVATYINGYAFKPTDWADEGKPIIRIQDLTGNSYQANRFNGVCPDKYNVYDGDILISWSASLGVYVWHGEDAVLNQHIFKVIFDKVEVDRSFFIHQVENILANAAGEAHGATMKHLTKPVFDALPFALPPMEEQKRIAEELDMVTHLISLRKQQIAKLDELVKSRFVEMFGSVEDNRFDIESVKILDACDLVNGKAFKPEDWSDTGLPIVRIQNLNNEHAPFNYFEGEIKEQYLIDSGELLFSWSGTPGTSFGAFFWTRGKAVLNQHIFRVKPKLDFNLIFLQFALNGRIDFIISKAHGGVGLQHITKKELDEVELLLPTIGCQNQFAAFVTQTNKSKLTIQHSLAKLETLKKSLMQKYFG